MRENLTDLKVKAAKAGKVAWNVSDGGGLFLQVTPAGGKLWRWKYRYQGQQKLMALGKYPDVPLVEARELHRTARKLLATGVDPMAQKKSEKVEKVAAQKAAEATFAIVAAKWLAHWKDDKKARHVNIVSKRIKTDILPYFGDRPIATIKAQDVVQMMRGIQSRGSATVARAARSVTSQIFSYAISWGYGNTERNPAKDFNPSDVVKKYTKRNHARISAAELPELLRAISNNSDQGGVTRLAFKLMALTFVRSAELIGAKWSEFDFEAKRWNIPAERMKMKTPHIVPLARQTLEVLKSLKLISGDSEYVFPGTGKKTPTMSIHTILHGLYRMGYKGRMTGHGFRGLATTILRERGFDKSHTDLQLSHVQHDKVDAAYNHADYLPQRTKMMQWWADYLEQTERGAKVLPFESRA